MKYLKKYQDNNRNINEGFWDSIFGKPTVDDAAHDSLRGQGFSHRGKDEENYIMFQGQKFYQSKFNMMMFTQLNKYQELKEIC